MTKIEYSGARESEVTGHCIWSRDAHVVMEQISHLNLMSMSLLQTCGYISEQMQAEVSIDVNKFLGSFSIEVDGRRVHPPSWRQNERGSVTIEPPAPILPMPSSEPLPMDPTFTMDDYRKSRQAEALRWIDLQEKRASIIARLQPVTAEEYQRLRDAVTSEMEPFHRKQKKQPGTSTHIIYFALAVNRQMSI